MRMKSWVVFGAGLWVAVFTFSACSRSTEKPPDEVVGRAVADADSCGTLATTKTYTVKNYFTRTINDEVWHCFDVMTHCESSSSIMPKWDARVMVRFVKRGTMWYSERDTTVPDRFR